MNYLAHLHIAKHCNSQLMGNLMADFVRGKPDGKFLPETTKAIYLHRFVDRFIDSHEAIKPCRALFPKHLYRFSAIALDMFWDHALVHHWDAFNDVRFDEFVARAETDCRTATQQEPNPLPERYLFLSDKMWREGWIPSYEDINTLPFALKRMSARSPRMGPLAETAETLVAHRQVLLDAFPSVYRDVLSAARDFHHQT
ncbi:ACP phosphodiesterase [Grimontia kaedaensis]|uniref:ACP phosphodiesterase n=1 Tax=Grimontia kaedaensis TaxID=2872157 RepID=A0ABY4WRI1_9GAMM|nr:ACP phosphodiesterase [Grimontia kaedaensis]